MRVLAAQEQAAIERLASSPWIRLGDEDVRTLLGRELPAEVGPGVCVLLRCVRPEFEPGPELVPDRVLVHWSDGTVSVKTLAHRTADLPLRRTAVVAVLPEEPRDVYVDALTAIHDLGG